MVPEEPTSTGNQRETSQERLEARLHRLEQEILRENRWWRGGLIAALVLIALAILAAGHHRRPELRFASMMGGPMGGPGWAGPGGMPFGDYWPYPPPPHPGWGGPCGPGAGNMPWGSGPWDGQSRQWSVPGP